MRLTIEQQLAKAMGMPAWPSDQPYMFRSGTGDYGIYYASTASCHIDDYITSKVAFEFGKSAKCHVMPDTDWPRSEQVERPSVQQSSYAGAVLWFTSGALSTVALSWLLLCLT